MGLQPDLGACPEGTDAAVRDVGAVGTVIWPFLWRMDGKPRLLPTE